jgi:hypothetical protein
MTAGGHSKKSTGLWNDLDDWGDYPEPASQMEIEFDNWVSENFLYLNGEYFNYDGYFVGDRESLLAMFEKHRYNSFWDEKEAELRM